MSGLGESHRSGTAGSLCRRPESSHGLPPLTGRVGVRVVTSAAAPVN